MTRSVRSVEDLLVVGPFHEALRAAISRSGLTLDRLRCKIAQRGRPIAISTLSDWQKGHRRPGTEHSLLVVEALEEILGLPPKSLRNLLRHNAVGLDEHDGPIAELLDGFPLSRRRDVVIISQQQKAFVDRHGVTSRIWSRTLIRARRDGVDRYVMRYFGDPGCSIADVEPRALENCRLGRVERHPSQPVLVAELLLDTSLKAGDTWVFEDECRDRTGSPGTEYGHGFRCPVAHFLLEIRFDPGRLPSACYSYARSTLTDAMHRTGRLVPNGDHAVHLSASNVKAGVLGIEWEWPDGDHAGD
ncbi:hypothetical protein [Nonomuraea lactucae]|uniref:hypothetical protein n=1 Tax=Nonomuraea lactucae TaxID=2249762 RepID=UPI000DE3E46F|nr:hypothetical protein [Nonomuraea lactucae]